MVPTAEGQVVASYDFGGTGPALLIVHATGFHAPAYLPLIEHLRASFHCYGMDLRGHGATPAPVDHDFDWRNMAADAITVSSTLGLDRPYGFGHSCGGAVLLLAEQARPGSWRGLYVFEPIVPTPGMFELPAGDVQMNPMALGALRRRPDFPSRDAAFDNYSAKPPLDAFTPDARRAYVDYGFVDRPDGTVTLACRPESEAATYIASAHHHAWERLDRVGCPTTVAYGEDAGAFPPTHHQSVAARMPNGAALWLAGLDHFGPMTHPADVAASVAAELEGRSA